MMISNIIPVMSKVIKLNIVRDVTGNEDYHLSFGSATIAYIGKKHMVYITSTR